MLRGLFGRRTRSTWIRLIYLSFLTLVFLFITSQFKVFKSDARMIPEQSPFLEPPLPEIPKENDAPDPERVDSPDWKQVAEAPKLHQKVDGSYPKLNNYGNFIPQQRIVHLDLKGAPFRPAFFTQLFSLFNRIQATGILIEWEDMFPYSGRLSIAKNQNAYTIEEVENILKEAQKRNLQIIPLVQTMGHLEWILKLEAFAHLREDSKYPQVICFSDDEGWELVKEMVEEVAKVHQKFGMPYFHIGADEVFQIGVCNASISRLQKEATRERLMLWHIARTAKFIKEKNSKTTILAWHDMMVNTMEQDLKEYQLTELIQPVVWNYAEDLNVYLPPTTWMILRSFKHIWGCSAWKGADGPARFCSHPKHYLKNHESWINQMTMVYQDFEKFEGIIMSGWSRYDHLAVLSELAPIGLPTLAMSMETILEGKKLVGNYPTTASILQCTPPTDLGFSATDCLFPGSKIYELINELYQKKRQLRSYQTEDFELNGWLSNVADRYEVSSQWYIDKIEPIVESYAIPIELTVQKLKNEMKKIYFNDTIDEFIFTYAGEELEWIKTKRETVRKIKEKSIFEKRPFVKGDEL